MKGRVEQVLGFGREVLGFGCWITPSLSRGGEEASAAATMAEGAPGRDLPWAEGRS